MTDWIYGALLLAAVLGAGIGVVATGIVMAGREIDRMRQAMLERESPRGDRT